MPPFLYTHTISFLLTFFWRSLPVPYYLPHDTPDFCTFYKLDTKLPLPPYTTLVLIIAPLLGCLFHSVSLLSFLALLLSFSSTLAAHFVT